MNDNSIADEIHLNDFNTLKESAKWLRLKPRTLRELRSKGIVPQPTTMLGKPLYTREQLESIKAKALVQAGWHA